LKAARYRPANNRNADDRAIAGHRHREQSRPGRFVVTMVL
jgi:hypothetical protein